MPIGNNQGGGRKTRNPWPAIIGAVIVVLLLTMPIWGN